MAVLIAVLAGAAEAQGFRDCPTCPEMVRLPPGGFEMGPSDEEEAREGVPPADRDGPTHRVTIGYIFSIGKYEVTRGEFAAFVKATKRPEGRFCRGYDDEGKATNLDGRTWRDPGFAQTDRDPVVCVDWADANAYVQWLSRITGRKYRLPSEAEWEYAARAGTRTARFWGDERGRGCRYGNFSDLTAAAALDWPKEPDTAFPCSDGYVYTAPVGQFQPNGFGLHDMLGNVAEWVSDCLNQTYGGAPVTGASWSGDCNQHVLRGGSWDLFSWYSRSAYRDWGQIGLRAGWLGFRVARGE